MYVAVPRKMDRSARRFHAWTSSVNPSAAKEDQNRPERDEAEADEPRILHTDPDLLLCFT